MEAVGRLAQVWRLLCRVGSPVGAVALLVVGGLVLVALAFGAVELGRRTMTALDRGETATLCQDTNAPVRRASGKLQMAKVVLAAQPKQATWAFDASREPVPVPIVITASPPLTGFSPAGIEVITTPLIRADSHQQLETEITSTSRISRNGERVVVRLCVNPQGASAGKYIGSAFVGAGRPNVAGTSVELVVTTRSPGWFGLGMVFMLAAIVVVLTLKGIADYQRAIAGTTTGGSATEFQWPNALLYIWSRKELRIISSLVGIGTAVFVSLRIYNADRIWGDDAYQDSVALAAAAIAAVGAQGIFDGFLGAAKGGRQAGQ